jgi:hypothetical protein
MVKESFGKSNFFKNLALLQERVPEVALHLSLMQNKPSKYEENKFFFEKKSLKNIDLLYVYGISASAYPFLKKWLDEDSLREVVFLEDELEKIFSFLHEKKAFSLLKDKRIHLVYLFQEDEKFYKELALKFTMSRLEVMATSLYLQQKRDKFDKIRLQLLRKTAWADGIFSERIKGEEVFENFIKNSAKFSEFFIVSHLKNIFKEIPAIVCGAGPSLSKDKEFIKQLENKALIIAGGSAITALSTSGILPHLGVAIDPNFEEYLRLKGGSAFEVPFFLAPRLNKGVLNTLNGFLGYLPAQGQAERWLEEFLQLSLEEVGKNLHFESLSVTPLTISLAQFLGCNPIIFSGIDLSYTEHKRYSEGVLVDNGCHFKEEEEKKIAGERLIKTDTFYSAIKWMMEEKSIATFVENHKENLFFNASKDGVKIQGVDFCPLARFVTKHCNRTFDLRGKLISFILQNQANKSSKRLFQFFEEMEKSLKRCDFLISDILLVDKQKSFLAKLDLKDEKAYCYLLSDVEAVFDRLLKRLERRGAIGSDQVKWEHLQKMVRGYLTHLRG